MKEDINYLKEQIVKIGEWQVFTAYLLQYLLQEKYSKTQIKKIIKECQKLTKETFKEVD